MNAFGWWLAGNAVGAAAWTPIVWALSRLFRSRPAVQHVLWLLLLVKLVAPPVARWPWSMTDALDAARTTWSAEQPESRPWELSDDIAIRAIELDAIPASELTTAVTTVPGPTWTWRELLLAVWAIGALAVTWLAVRGVVRQLRVLRTAAAPSAMLRAAVRQAAERLRMRPIASALSERVASPLICCLGRPRLMWPDAQRAADVIAASDGIIAHELAHVARRDHLVVYFEMLVLAVHWWNPLAWYVRRQLRESRELACDAMALASAGQDRADYARRLLAMSTGREPTITLAPAFGAGTFSRRFLERRLTMVFDNRASGRISPAGVMLAALLAAAALPGLTWGDDSADAAGTADAAPTTAGSADAPPAPEGVTVAETQGDTVRTGVPVLSEIQGLGELFVVRQTVPAGDAAPNANPLNANNVHAHAVARFNAAVANEPLEQTIKLQDGSTIEIRRAVDGNLQLVVKQANQPAQVIRLGLNLMAEPSVAENGVRVSEPVQGGGTDVSADARRVRVQVMQPNWVDVVRSTTAESVPAHIEWKSTTPAQADDELAMLESDVQLAKVTLEEKQTEVEVAKESGYSASRMRLAELAVKRAAIQLQRCEAKLKAATERRVNMRTWRHQLQAN